MLVIGRLNKEKLLKTKPPNEISNATLEPMRPAIKETKLSTRRLSNEEETLILVFGLIV